MGWFTVPADEPPADARGALVKVVGGGPGRTAGAGVHLAARHLLTCAHVVNTALGLRPLTHRDPGPVRLDVAFPAVPHVAAVSARLVAWVAPRAADRPGPAPEGALEWAGDLAVLELDEPPPDPVRPLPWTDMATGQEVRAWYGGGQPFTYADVRVSACDGSVGYLDGQLSGAAVEEGYSGGPLWSLHDAAAVGLVMGRITAPGGAFAAQHTVRRSWGITRQAIEAELVRAGAGGLLPPDGGHGAAVHPEDSGLRDMLAGPVQALLGAPADRAAHATVLGAELGLRTPSDGSAPTVEELATVLYTVRRALPTLTESLARTVTDSGDRAELDRLLGLGRLVEAAGLLSVGEHRKLLAKLTDLTARDPGLLPRAAAEALQYMALPAPLHGARLSVPAVPAALHALETWPGDCTPVPNETPRLPALVRVVEYVAAEVGGLVGEVLREWSVRVAQRLGVHASALDERRADAARWAARTASAGTCVLVELTRHTDDPPDRYRCSLWRLRDDGTAARAGPGDDRPLDGAQIARLVRTVASGAEGPGRGVPMVAVAVGPDGLQLPVDEWDGAEPGELYPAPLGEDFLVVLRCPQVRRHSRTARHDLSRRWDARRRTGPLIAGEEVTSDRELMGMLKTTHRDQGSVVVHGPPKHRAQLLNVCLFMGVPIVLWDREAVDHRQAARLEPSRPSGPLEELPERIRHFRVRAHMDPAQAARPALVWEDAGLPLPDELQLADPGGPAGPGEGPLG
ncbi:trypsin-like peptidase domain-containing protein [Streptomyces sp. NPDC052496]|uniref:VMAP-C domain-containing protein n=1 Tax=Streptomyces sp. NPDC052496 TaxID=3154951 RepID=UPI0034378743